MAIYGHRHFMEGTPYYYVHCLKQFAIPVYLGHLLVEHQTSFVGSVLLVFSILVTIGVAVYLYHEFRKMKRVHTQTDESFNGEEGDTEFENTAEGLDEDGKPAERAALVKHTSDDDFFIDEEEEIGR
jgi:hypothetical protein